ncbi:Transcriptional regulator of nonfermentable carbon utilization [Coniosporium tulheliwenetii]|uniref:Transcriptional regulator of nonfermentable carbon utilization n=1 Tax=Coniosporium tulheliwenetii TaxID=3383036 RepID=A0ACC2YHQ5_9PEZI|nr:Transcriptional regulator of nonfermentable carbon utilization [Cladosporium sp. JES 115]
MAERKESCAENDEGSPAQASHGEKPKSSNAKDPLRPRKKKARRACFACQRAHLTCSDERPCQRCIKRGLQDACADGVRKKAKYFHDAPVEALMPGIGGRYHHPNGTKASSPSIPASDPDSTVPLAQAGVFYPQAQPATFNVYPQTVAQQQMPLPISDGALVNPFNNQQTPISPSFSHHHVQQSPPIPGMANPMSQTSQPTAAQLRNYGAPLFDPSDPALFNFDISRLNFGNHYGALEFGMLGHMSSGAADTPSENDNLMHPLNQAAVAFSAPVTPSGFSGESIPSNLVFSQDAIGQHDWQDSHSRQGSAVQIQTPQSTPATISFDSQQRNDGFNGQAQAYAISAGPSSLAGVSPASGPQDVVGTYDNGPVPAPLFVNSNQQQAPQQQPVFQHQQHQPRQQHLMQNRAQQHQQARSDILRSTFQPHGVPQSTRKRRRSNPSDIYTSVKMPHSHTGAFHALTAILQKRLSPTKTVRVAKAMASIRPSFIACTKSLSRDDVIFMEKCFQRTLYEYQEFINAYGTPTIICRSTGEVAAVSKEFSILTGWRRDVLLGAEPNLNVNTGTPSTSGAQTGNNSTGGISTPAIPANADGVVEPAKPQPVFLAELLDDDSMIQFYEEFTKLAFGDSRGYAMAPCKLLKYRTKEDMGSVEDHLDAGNSNGAKRGMNSSAGAVRTEQVVKEGVESAIGGEAGMNQLGDKDGKVDCMYCWTVKRDMFEVPMLIVINLPELPNPGVTGLGMVL